jgi:peptidoglycan/xylan/chitin deacetylase (PgdA/CDA1 family)
MQASARQLIKSVAAGVLHHSGLRRAVCAVRRVQCGGRRVNIVSYHRVVDDFARESQRAMPALLVSQRTFRRHLEEAHASGYELSSLDDALEVLAGRKKARRDLFVVTFDDGYRDVYRYAFPVLQQMGVPAVVYVATGYIGTPRRFVHDRLYHLLHQLGQPGLPPLPPEVEQRLGTLAQAREPATLDALIEHHPRGVLLDVLTALEKHLGGERLLPEAGDPMGWDEVQKMAAAGITIGAHTVEHTVLTHEDPETVDAEVRASKAAIERHIERPVHHFAYCNGWYSEAVIESLARHGFRSAATTEASQNELGGDPYRLKRRVLWENFSLGWDGAYSEALTCCHLDGVFGFFGPDGVVVGKRRQRPPTHLPGVPLGRIVPGGPASGLAGGSVEIGGPNGGSTASQPEAAVACAPAEMH